MQRNELAARLGLRPITLRRAERATGIAPTRSGPRGAAVYSASDAARLAGTLGRPLDEGSAAAAAFERFDAGASVADVVIALRLTPEQARAWFEAWSSARRALVLDGAALAELRALGYAPTNGAELVALVRELRRRVREQARGSRLA